MKRNYWPLFFISIFSFVFGMIIWTIYSATQVPIHKDETFLSSYHDVDRDYNKIVNSNTEFNKKFDLKVEINSKEFALVFKDMFLGQRVIEKKSKHKDIFTFGKNSIKVSVLEKQSQRLIKDVGIQLRLSRPTNHNSTMDFTNNDFKTENGVSSLEVELPLKGNWNITGQFKVGSDIGYFYIKSNAI